MNVLVTGANGFLGREVCRALAGAGTQVAAVVRPSDQRPVRFAQRTIACDLTAQGALASGLAAAGGAFVPDAVAHCAAVVPSTFEGEEARRAAEMNRRMDRQVVAYAVAAGAGMVYCSSTSVYGVGRGTPLDEQASLAPLGPYAEAKRDGECLGREQCASAGVWCAALRINAPYGPGDSRSTVFRIFLQRALRGEPLLYHGSGRRVQDFTHVEDVASAVAGALQARATGCYNIAGGRPVSMRELAELVVRVVGSSSEVRPSGHPDPQEGVECRFRVERAMRELGWTPRVSLETGIQRWAEEWRRHDHENRVVV